MNDRCCEVDKTPTWDLKFLTDEGAVRNAAYFAAFARVAAVLTEYDALLDERDMLKTNDAMLRESLAWLAERASVMQERFASVSAVANIHPLSSNEWLDQALEHGFHEVEEAR